MIPNSIPGELEQDSAMKPNTGDSMRKDRKQSGGMTPGAPV
jgi:hypothetical protein